MRRILFLVIYIQLIFLVSAPSLSAQFWTERARNLKATFNQAEYNLGKVKPGTESRFRIGFKNTGDAYLQVQEVITDPGSTVHKLSFIAPKGAILPEDSGAIEMIFLPGNAADSFKYSATVVFNNNYRQKILVKGLVKPEETGRRGPLIMFEKNFCDVEWIQPGESIKCGFRFTNIGDGPLIITSVKPSSDSIRVIFPKSALLPGQSGEINAVFEAEGSGGFRRYLNVDTNVKGTEPILLIIKGRLPSRR